MPRANRHFLPGHVWHITHRCHQRKFLLKFARDRRRYLHWVFEAKKRFGLCVLDYAITSNHIHLLVKDTGRRAHWAGVQPAQGYAGRVLGRSLSRHRHRDDEHLHRCVVYIDLSMVRAGAIERRVAPCCENHGRSSCPSCNPCAAMPRVG